MCIKLSHNIVVLEITVLLTVLLGTDVAMADLLCYAAFSGHLNEKNASFFWATGSWENWKSGRYFQGHLWHQIACPQRSRQWPQPSWVVVGHLGKKTIQPSHSGTWILAEVLIWGQSCRARKNFREFLSCNIQAWISKVNPWWLSCITEGIVGSLWLRQPSRMHGCSQKELLATWHVTH